jgi:hypothetical protein
MANLQNTTINTAAISASRVIPYGSGMPEWVRISNCANGTDTTPNYAGTWIHIRTPLPATNAASGIGWNPSLIEVVGFHSYSGEYTWDYKAVTNNSGYADNNWYGSQVRVNDSNTNDIVVYKSQSQYGGYERVCIAQRKVGCCCVGWFWIRIRNQGRNYRYTSHPYATEGRADSNPFW